MSGVPAGEHDPRAVGDQRRRRWRRPEAARAARDDVHLSLQTEIHADTLARDGQAERTANWVS